MEKVERRESFEKTPPNSKQLPTLYQILLRLFFYVYMFISIRIKKGEGQGKEGVTLINDEHKSQWKTKI